VKGSYWPVSEFDRDVRATALIAQTSALTDAEVRGLVGYLAVSVTDEIEVATGLYLATLAADRARQEAERPRLADPRAAAVLEDLEAAVNRLGTAVYRTSDPAAAAALAADARGRALLQSISNHLATLREDDST